METMNPVVHFEMPAEDRDRMSEFYAKAFGWKTQKLSEDLDNYILVTTTETDDKGMTMHPGAINGGFFPQKPDKAYPSVVIVVEDIHKSIKEINQAGGKTIGEPVEIQGYGTYISFIDTEGNRNSIIQPSLDNKN